VTPSEMMLTVPLFVLPVWMISTMHLMNQGVPKQRRMLRVLAPMEELIPMAPTPAIWKRAYLVTRDYESETEPK
jgi:hypothetical protein